MFNRLWEGHSISSGILFSNAFKCDKIGLEVKSVIYHKLSYFLENVCSPVNKYFLQNYYVLTILLKAIKKHW